MKVFQSLFPAMPAALNVSPAQKNSTRYRVVKVTSPVAPGIGARLTGQWVQHEIIAAVEVVPDAAIMGCTQRHEVVPESGKLAHGEPPSRNQGEHGDIQGGQQAEARRPQTRSRRRHDQASRSSTALRLSYSSVLISPLARRRRSIS